MADAAASAPDAAPAPNVAPPPGNPRFPLFDSLRAIAALTVLVAHSILQLNVQVAHPFLDFASPLAAQGVAIFFLISGFLLYRPFLVAHRGGRPVRVGDYTRRRFLRIVPGYWLALTVVLLLINHPNGVTTDNWPRYYGFAQIYDHASIPNGIGAAWTLCVEVTFYAVLPLIAFLGGLLSGRDRGSLRGDIALVAVLGAASIFVHERLATSTTDYWLAISLPATFYWFALGMGLAIASVLERPKRLIEPIGRYPLAMWIAAVATFIALYNWTEERPGVGSGGTAEFILLGLASMFLLLPAVFRDDAGGLPRLLLRHRLLAWLGLVSYGIYLYHADLIALVNDRLIRHDLPHSYPVVLALSTLVICAFAAASFYLFERPLLRLKEVPLFSALSRRWRGVRSAG
jgi:peptidoglycan/LPS O-acetylase OafA/YrhL